MGHYEDLLNSEVDIYNQSLSRNAFGEDDPTMNIAYSGVKCRMVPVSAEEMKTLAGEYDNIRYNGYFLSGQSITVDDEVHHDGTTYRVLEVNTDSSNYVKKALLSEK